MSTFFHTARTVELLLCITTVAAIRPAVAQPNVDNSVPPTLVRQEAYNTVLELAAPAPPDETCSLPVDPGPCDGSCPRFFYNACTGQCEEFIYGCCLGNENNFTTLEDCQATCPPKGSICFLPPDAGPCDGICPRYYFNPCTRLCEVFQYGCCGGNENNFLTWQECVVNCPGICTGDLNADDRNDAADLALLLGAWGYCPNCFLIDCAADFNNDCQVDAADLAILLGSWGLCK